MALWRRRTYPKQYLSSVRTWTQGRLVWLWLCLGYACILTTWFTVSLLHDSTSAQTHFSVAVTPTMPQTGFGGTEVSLPLQTLCVTPGQGNLRGIQTDLLMDTEKKNHSQLSSTVTFYHFTSYQTHCNLCHLASRLWPLAVSVTDCCSQGCLYFGIHDSLTSSTSLTPMHGLC